MFFSSISSWDRSKAQRSWTHAGFWSVRLMPPWHGLAWWSVHLFKWTFCITVMETDEMDEQKRLGFKLWRSLSINNCMVCIIHQQLDNVLSCIFNKISHFPCHLSRLNCLSIYNVYFKSQRGSKSSNLALKIFCNMYTVGITTTGYLIGSLLKGCTNLFKSLNH